MGLTQFFVMRIKNVHKSIVFVLAFIIFFHSARAVAGELLLKLVQSGFPFIKSESVLNQLEKIEEPQDKVNGLKQIIQIASFDIEIQLALWKLGLLGFENAQLLIEAEVEKEMLKNRGSSVFYFEKNEDGYKQGIFAERYAYVLDRVLGLNIVPVVVNQNGTASRMVRLLNASETGVSLTHDEQYNYETQIGVQIIKFWILDTIIYNKDRNYRNSMSTDGYVFAIDHGLSYQIPASNWARFIHNHDKDDPNHDFFNRLSPQQIEMDHVPQKFMKMTSTELVEKLKEKGVPDQVIEFYLPRFERVHEMIMSRLKRGSTSCQAHIN